MWGSESTIPYHGVCSLSISSPHKPLLSAPPILNLHPGKLQPSPQDGGFQTLALKLDQEANGGSPLSTFFQQRQRSRLWPWEWANSRCSHSSPASHWEGLQGTAYELPKKHDATSRWASYFSGDNPHHFFPSHIRKGYPSCEHNFDPDLFFMNTSWR